MDIRIEHLSKSYHGKPVLENISLNFARGEISCLMAPSGYGKTTLLRILMGLETADAGSVTGVEKFRLAPVFQEDRLCENLSVGANIRLTGRQRLPEADIEACLFAMDMPGCMRTPVRELSGGMRRRVAIARALCSGGDLLVMDEPFKGLDFALKQRVITYVREFVQTKTVIWVTHEEMEYQMMRGRLVSLIS